MTVRRPRLVAAGRALAACGRALVAAAVVAALVAPSAALAQEEPTPPPAEPGTFRLVDTSPWVAVGGTFEAVIDPSGDTSTSVARVEISRPVDSVTDLEAALAGETGRRLYRSPPIPLGFLPVEADGTQVLRVDVSTTDTGDLVARLPEPGVHPVTITLEDPDGAVLASERTVLTRLGTEDDPLVAPTLAVLIDVAVDPTVGPDGGRTISPADLGRLDRLRSFLDALAEARRTAADPAAGAVSVAVVPDTLDALTASEDPRAAAIVEALTGLDERHVALGLPYVGLSAQGLLDADLGRFLADLVTLGRSQLGDRLDATVDGTTWPAFAPLGPEGADALAGIGVQRLVVDTGGDLPDGPGADADRPIVHAGPHPLDGLEPLVGLVTDPTTTARLREPGDVAAALGELVLRSGDTPTTALVRLDDLPTDAVLRGLAPLLVDPSSPVRLGGVDALTTVPAPDDTPIEPAFPTGGDPLTPLAAEIRAVDAAVDTFAQTVAGESARAVDLRLRVATALAASLTTEQRRALLTAASAAVDETFAAIFLEGQTDLNLTSRRGTLPIELHNETGFPVRVVVTVRSDRLLFPQGDRFEVTLDEEITRLDVPVEARATGSVPTFVTMTTPDGTVRLDMRQLNVRSTAISGVGLALSIGALAVLLVWWGRSWWRGRHPASGDAVPSDVA